MAHSLVFEFIREHGPSLANKAAAELIEHIRERRTTSPHKFCDGTPVTNHYERCKIRVEVSVGSMGWATEIATIEDANSTVRERWTD